MNQEITQINVDGTRNANDLLQINGNRCRAAHDVLKAFTERKDNRHRSIREAQ